MQLPDLFLDWFFPRRCVLCAVEGAWACPECLGTAAAAVSGIEHFALSDLQEAQSLLPFEIKLVRELLHNLKYNGIYEAADTLVALLSLIYTPEKLLADLGLRAAPQVLVPVPTSRAHLRERAYNQVEVLATALGRWLDIPVWSTALARRSAQSQVGKSAREREANLVGAFSWQGDEKYSDFDWIVFDDLCTSGATLRACLAAIPAGANVRVLTLARKSF